MDSGEYKWAHLQVLRLWAPSAAVTLPLLAMLLMFLVSSIPEAEPELVPVTVVAPEVTKETDPVKEVVEEEFTPPECVEMENVLAQDISPEVAVPSSSLEFPVDFSPQLSEVPSVSRVKSPFKFEGVYERRNPGIIGYIMSPDDQGRGRQSDRHNHQGSARRRTLELQLQRRGSK